MNFTRTIQGNKIDDLTKLSKYINDNNILIKKWNEAVNSGRIEASARNFLLTVLNLDDKKDNN